MRRRIFDDSKRRLRRCRDFGLVYYIEIIVHPDVVFFEKKLVTYGDHLPLDIIGGWHLWTSPQKYQNMPKLYRAMY